MDPSRDESSNNSGVADPPPAYTMSQGVASGAIPNVAAQSSTPRPHQTESASRPHGSSGSRNKKSPFAAPPSIQQPHHNIPQAELPHAPHPPSGQFPIQTGKTLRPEKVTSSYRADSFVTPNGLPLPNRHAPPASPPIQHGYPAGNGLQPGYGYSAPVPGAFPQDSYTNSAGYGGLGNRSGYANDDTPTNIAANVVDRGLRAMQKLNPFANPSEGDMRSNPRIEDVYIAVMGVTGAGKSSFIKLCTNQKVKIGHNLKSCTAFVEDFQIMYNDRVRLHLIDTPGFDDTHKSDSEVLRDIASWLGTTYTQGILLSGILYLHRISDPRMSGGAMRNLHMFKELCGKDCFKSVLLATTFWNSIPYPKAEDNERELQQTEDFWGEMLSLGSSYTRHTGDRASAWRILDFMIKRRHPFLATIQKEMVDGKLDLNQTSAGRQLNADLIELEEKHLQKMRDLEKSYVQAQKESDELSMKRISELHTRLQNEIDQGKDAQADLVASLERINKERADELAEYQTSIENRMKEMVALREQLDKYEMGTRETEQQNEIYKQQLEELKENLKTVQRRQPGLVEVFIEWADEKLNKLDRWLSSLF